MTIKCDRCGYSGAGKYYKQYPNGTNRYCWKCWWLTFKWANFSPMIEVLKKEQVK